MAMTLGGYRVIDVGPIASYYQNKGLSLEKLQSCNMMEFRYIDSYGMGHFLLSQTITTEYITFVVDNRTINLKVVDRLSLEHPTQSGLRLYLYIVAEPKYDLLSYKVDRNYNVTIDKSISPYGSPTLATMPPDYTPKTLEQVIDDFLPSGYSIDYNADSILSVDISIEGMSVLEAIDHLCSIYGLVWTATYSTVYIWDMEAVEESSSDILPGILPPINDIRHSLLSENIASINVSFPAYDYCRQTPDEYHTVDDLEDIQGQTINVMDPYYPAILDTLGSTRNTTNLNTRADLIATNLKAVARSINYVVKHYHSVNSLGTQPLSLSEVVGDRGLGPFTIYRTLRYPYHPVKVPPSKSRLANEWIGTITDGYYGTVSSFIVSPSFGLDGATPPGPQTVWNIFSWNYGEAGWVVQVKWDCVNQRWIAQQQEYDCPPDEAPPVPDPTEPVDPYPTEEYPPE